MRIFNRVPPDSHKQVFFLGFCGGLRTSSLLGLGNTGIGQLDKTCWRKISIFY